ncbi:MAG: Y-family DNA polymerase [Parachlamydiaceae bacterium]|nr:Y-family DNA polymerase [Parachlamydiaceae bacterium]
MSSTKPSKPLFALVDCNNFYVSCERVFNPRIWNKPVVILSNNDGCVIARSNESKSLGIPMGAPAFQYAEIFKKHRVIVYSSNYALYGEMSQRVMQTLSQFAMDMEIYSIDEAFLHLNQENESELDPYIRHIKQTVYQWTGIPVSIGVASTKTLAKIANRHAKKNFPKEGVYIFNDPNLQQEVLSNLPVEEVWGIGGQISATLKRKGIYTASELASADDVWLKKHLSVVVLRTAWELRGISCLSLQEAAPPKKSIVSSRSFGVEITEESDLAEALSTYAATAAEKLRNECGVASFLEVFLMTNRFKEGPSYANSIQITLPQPTDYTPLLIHYAKCGLNKIYKSGYSYKKIGIQLGGIQSNRTIQQDLFAGKNYSIEKQTKVMKLIDQTNAIYGKDTLKFAAQGIDQPWKMQRNKCTDHYTTSWDGLLKIKI